MTVFQEAVPEGRAGGAPAGESLSPRVQGRRRRLGAAHTRAVLLRWSGLIALVGAGAWGLARLVGAGPGLSLAAGGLGLVGAVGLALLLDAVLAVLKSWE